MRPFVFFFGAGASYGAGHVEPDRPPLMCELFDRLAFEYPDEWGAASGRWADQDRFRKNFEAAFNDLAVKEAPFRTNSLTLAEGLWPLAKYFGRFTVRPNGKDCYAELLRRLSARDATRDSVFATLNYDCLLEQAALGLGLGIDPCLCKVDEPLVAPRDRLIRILKPHGSCNFVVEVDGYLPALLTTAVVEATIRPLPPHALESLFAHMSARTHLPVMSQVSFNKEAVLAPVAMYAIRQHLRRAAGTAACLIVVGISYNPHDMHVLDVIKAARQTLYVGGAADAAEWSRVASRFVHLGERFEDSLDELTGYLT